MLRYERVWEYVKSRTKGVAAGEVAEALGIQRHDASADLNRLHREGRLSKKGKKPVLYQAVETGNESMFEAEQKSCEPFARIIGAEGSLKEAIHWAKSAVVYPPHGLNSLLIGETGVGKSMLADCMHRYAEKLRGDVLGESLPFITFSCAEYADNPQLLLSQLFGYEKGAFTGASVRTPGLVEKADGGFLFLDEIHRLPEAGQELLFSLLDRGCYRPIGASEDKHVSVTLIAATTERPESVLLRTFLRRIPLTISLPNLCERPYSEKLELIYRFFRMEAALLSLAIHISGNALRMLTLYKPQGNIGELKNMIHLCCAKLYLDYTLASHKADALYVDVHSLPQAIYAQAHEASALRRFPDIRLFREGLAISPEADDACFIPKDRLSIDLYGYVERRLNEHQSSADEPDEFKKKFGQELHEYYKASVQSQGQSGDSCLAVASSAVAAPVAELLFSLAERELGRVYGDQVRITFAIHLQQYMRRRRTGDIIYNPNKAAAFEANHTEYRFLLRHSQELAELLGSPITEDELSFWVLFLADYEKSEVTKRQTVYYSSCGLTLPQEDWAELREAFPSLLIRRLPRTAQSNPGGSDICFVDPGLWQSTQKSENQNYLPVLSSDFVRSCLSLVKEEASMRELRDFAQKSVKEFIASFEAGVSGNADAGEVGMADRNDERPVILAICASGRGCAQIVKKIMTDHIPEIKRYEIITMGAQEDVEGVIYQYHDRLRLIVGSFHYKTKVPFVNAAEIFRGNDGLNKIRSILFPT